jgi:hypothetical protein
MWNNYFVPKKNLFLFFLKKKQYTEKVIKPEKDTNAKKRNVKILISLISLGTSCLAYKNIMFHNCCSGEPP